jgi:anti-sigma regulatory factor (Ser/Thr protein kinase)
MPNQVIPLTKQLSVSNGSHILYFYSEPDSYIQNLISFAQTGVEQGQHVVIIDSLERYEKVQSVLHNTLSEEQLRFIHYVNNNNFYGLFGEFKVDRVLENLNNIVQPFVTEQLTLRMWGQVEWIDQTDILAKLYGYECECDVTVSELGFVTVCAYNGYVVPAYIQTEMLKTHELLMTDTELVRSSLYRSPSIRPTVFPSISVQGSMESEMDLYKQKLDFVHVVSHEVRNPLTIIKAYSSLLQADERDEERRKKLRAIYDYAVVIDNEISHIISTEQMLSTEALWIKKIVLPSALITEVLETLEIKARTQNITLHHDNRLTGNETILSNAMGFKLIVSNILNNAIKYSTESTNVTFTCYTEDSHLCIEVQDEGIGMSDDQVKKLFQKYEKLNDEQSGQGIGLYMVKKLLDHFEGEIEVTSQLHAGSKFRMRLPMFTK